MKSEAWIHPHNSVCFQTTGSIAKDYCFGNNKL